MTRAGGVGWGRGSQDPRRAAGVIITELLIRNLKVLALQELK